MLWRLFCFRPGASLAADELPAPGAWDGVTEKAKLDRPYEDPRQALIPFGINSYFAHPWRSYMDTHPASQFLGSMGFCYNSDPKYLEPVLQFMSEAGIRKVRTEMGWGNLDWDDRMTGENRTKALEFLRLARKYNIRPLILLNAHHSAPGPVREVSVSLMQDAKKGDRSFQVRPDDVSKIRVGYTGPMKADEYCAAKPLITEVKPDGTCVLSGPLGGRPHGGHTAAQGAEIPAAARSEAQGRGPASECRSRRVRGRDAGGMEEVCGGDL